MSMNILHIQFVFDAISFWFFLNSSQFMSIRYSNLLQVGCLYIRDALPTTTGKKDFESIFWVVFAAPLA